MKKTNPRKLILSKKTVINLGIQNTVHLNGGVAVVPKTKGINCSNTCTQGCTQSVCV